MCFITNSMENQHSYYPFSSRHFDLVSKISQKVFKPEP